MERSLGVFMGCELGALVDQDYLFSVVEVYLARRGRARWIKAGIPLAVHPLAVGSARRSTHLGARTARSAASRPWRGIEPRTWPSAPRCQLPGDAPNPYPERHARFDVPSDRPRLAGSPPDWQSANSP